jgi:hypothetical protein
MLFTAKPKGEFRRPRLGGPHFFGDAGTKECPLEPIELVEGVPFFVVKGYTGFGSPEDAKDYLDYCVKNCDWNPLKSKPKTADEKRKALEKLVASPKWKKPLSDDEVSMSKEQIKG